jgi:hypothetical protein
MYDDSRKARHDLESPSGKTGFHISNWCVASYTPPLPINLNNSLLEFLTGGARI